MDTTDTTSIPVATTPAPALYSQAARLFHWLSAATLLAAVLIVLLRYLVDEGSAEKALIDLHRSVGVCVLLLTGLRLLWRLVRRPPAHDDLPALLRGLAALAHLALYGLLLAIPLLGWTLSNAAGKPVRLAGFIPLPPLTGRDRDLADDLANWHTWGGYLLLALIALHILAALWHFVVRKDQVLYAMLPLQRLRRSLP